MSLVAVVPNPSMQENLERIASETKVFISMPHVSGITPRILLEKGLLERSRLDGTKRLHGTFRIDEVGLPAFDHGVLYGDAVFEGVLVVRGKLFQWKEHLDRLYRSAARLNIEIPYGPEEFSAHILDAVRSMAASEREFSYIRLVVTRGIGDLGIHPAKCIGSTVYSIISTLQLYPESAYRCGIHVSLARKVRRPSPEVLDPQIKSCNYLNNVMALLETLHEGCYETVMLNSEGFVAEASTDNLFIAVRENGWESEPAHVTLCTPSSNYCLKGITRGLVLAHAKKLGFRVVESGTLLPKDLTGAHREVFLTGTAAGVVPVIGVDGHLVGDGLPGPITLTFRNLLSADMNDPAMALPADAQSEEINAYLAAGVFSSGTSVGTNPQSTTNLIIREFDQIDSRNWDGLSQVFCEDIVYERPGYEPLAGLERVLKFYREERVIASGKHYLEHIVLNESSGACWGRFIGLHKNKSAIDERFADVYLFKDGKIHNRQSYFFRPAV